MLASCCRGQLCQRFYSISLRRNGSQGRIPLIQHYLSTGGLIIFHREATQRLRRQIQYEGKAGFSFDRVNAVKPEMLYSIFNGLDSKINLIHLTHVLHVDVGAIRAAVSPNSKLLRLTQTEFGPISTI